MDETRYPTDNIVSKPSTLPNNNTKLQPVKEEVMEPARELVMEPAREQVMEPARELVMEPARELVMEPARELVMEPAREQVMEPARELVMEPARELVMENLLAKCKDIGIKKSTLTIVIKYVIEAVEETPVKGPAQKEYAVCLLRSLIEELSQGEDKEYLLKAIDDGSIGDIIELIVSASKGELNINKVIQTTTTLLPYCMALLGKCVKMPKNI